MEPSYKKSSGVNLYMYKIHRTNIDCEERLGIYW